MVLAAERRSVWPFQPVCRLDNFVTLFHDPYYLDSFWTTIKFSTGNRQRPAYFAVFAALVDYVVRGSRFYQTLMLLPYAVAPAVAAVLWIFLFNPGRGLITHFLGEWVTTGTTRKTAARRCSGGLRLGLEADKLQLPVLFAALQSIPRSLVEAAAIDGAGPIRRFFKLALPLIAPVSFFLLVVNGLRLLRYLPGDRCRHRRRPVQATTTLIYKIYREGFAGLDLSASAAQSVVLMFLVIILTVVQFRYVESKVRYQ